MRYRWVIQGLLFLIYMAFGLSWLSWSPLLPDIEAMLKITHAEAGSIISVVSIAKAFIPLLAGLLAARIGLRRTLTIGAAFCGVAVLAPFCHSFPLVLTLRFLFGIGGAIVVTLTGAVMMAWFPREELPMVNGLNNVALNTGVCVALFLTVPLSAAIGWQGALGVFGGISVVLAVLWAFLGRDAGDYKAVSNANLFPEVLRRRETWWIAAAFTGPVSLYLALNTWLPTYYQSAFHLAKAVASSTTGQFNLVGIPVAILGGWLTARLGQRRPLIILSGLIMPIAAFGLFATPDPTLRTISAAFLGASFFLYVSPLFTIPMELEGFTPRHVAVLNGVVYSVTYGVSFFSPMLVGWLRDTQGSFVPGFALLSLFSVILAVAGFALPETGRRKLRLVPASTRFPAAVQPG